MPDTVHEDCRQKDENEYPSHPLHSAHRYVFCIQTSFLVEIAGILDPWTASPLPIEGASDPLFFNSDIGDEDQVPI